MRAVVIVLLLAGRLLAEELPDRPCRADLLRLCPHGASGTPELAECFRRQFALVSPGCRARLAAARERRAAQAPGRALRACARELHEQCLGVRAGQGRLRACLEEHVDALGSSCRRALAALADREGIRNASDVAPAPGGHAMPLQLSSPAFTHGQPIPREHTCEGRDLSPPLAWSGVPAGTRSLVLIVDDPDAPDPAAPKTTWVHWVAYDLPPDAAGVSPGGPLPSGAREGLNDWKRPGWGGPCPPIGRHRYVFKLYALDVALGDLARPSKAVVERAMAGHVLAQTELIGTYQKGG